MTREEILARVESYGTAYLRLVNALSKFPEEMWEFKPSAAEWSIHEIIIHLADSEANAYCRCRRFIAEPGSKVLGYDQALWANRLNYHDQSTDDALDLFKCLRKMTYALIKNLPENLWYNIVEHSEDGIMTLADWLVIYDTHPDKHIGQMQRVYSQWVSAKQEIA